MRVLLVGLALACACGGSASISTQVEMARPMPAQRLDRDRAISQFGARAHRALAGATLGDVLLSMDDLERVLTPEGFARTEALRLGLSARVHLEPERHGAFAETEFSGVCLIGSREVSAGGPEGLAAPGWVFERALIVGTRGGARRLAAWMEGQFVFTNRGLYATDLTRVEAPRWEHSDLELVQCDLAFGLD